MTRSHLLYLQDIVTSIEKILSYTQGLTYEEFVKSQLIIDAVVRNLEIIGEASGHIPEETQNAFPQVPWRLMKSMRNILIHEYFGVDSEILWKTIQESLPALLESLRQALHSASGES